jgi:hypothetical protein
VLREHPDGASPGTERKRLRMPFGMLICNEVEELDFVGPWVMLRVWSLYADGPQNGLLIAEGCAPVLCAHGMSVNAPITFAACAALDCIASVAGEDAAGKAQFGVEYDPDATRYGIYPSDARAPTHVKAG